MGLEQRDERSLRRNEPNPELLRVRVVVTWPAMDGVEPVTSDTTMAPPVGAYSANSGHIAVKVLDGTAAGEFGTTVQISGPTTESTPTNDDGCAFFAFLTPGTYTVSLNSVGYVNRQGVQNPSQSVGVTAGKVSSVQFDYDQVDHAVAHVRAERGRHDPDRPRRSALGNTQFQPTGVKTYAGTGLSRSIGSLFPASDGYSGVGGIVLGRRPRGPAGRQLGRRTGRGACGPIRSRRRRRATRPPVRSHVKTAANHREWHRRACPLVGATVVATHAADRSCAAGETHTSGRTDATGVLDDRTALRHVAADGHGPQRAHDLARARARPDRDDDARSGSRRAVIGVRGARHRNQRSSRASLAAAGSADRARMNKALRFWSS